jgi:hypothetical protein
VTLLWGYFLNKFEVNVEIVSKLILYIKTYRIYIIIQMSMMKHNNYCMGDMTWYYKNEKRNPLQDSLHYSNDDDFCVFNSKTEGKIRIRYDGICKKLYYNTCWLLDLPHQFVEKVLSYHDLAHVTSCKDNNYPFFYGTTLVGECKLFSNFLLGLQQKNILKTDHNCRMLNGHSDLKEKVDIRYPIQVNTNTGEDVLTKEFGGIYGDYVEDNTSKRDKSNYLRYSPKDNYKYIMDFLTWYIKNYILDNEKILDEWPEIGFKNNPSYKTMCNDIYQIKFCGNGIDGRAGRGQHFKDILLGGYIELSLQDKRFKVIDDRKRICIDKKWPCLLLDHTKHPSKPKLPLETSYGWGRVVPKIVEEYGLNYYNNKIPTW